MADSDEAYIPTATEIHDAVRKIRESKPGLGLEKVIPILRDTHGWSINGSRLRKLVAPGDGTNKHESPKIVAPTLSGVLSIADIRVRILGPLLIVNGNKIFSSKHWIKNFPGFSLLQVNTGIQRIAWDFIQGNNMWIRAQFEWDAAVPVQRLPSALANALIGKEPTQRAPIQAKFMPHIFTPEMDREFHRSVAVNIFLDYTPRCLQLDVHVAKSAMVRVYFAFDPQRFDLFIREVAETVDKWSSLRVEVNHAHIYKFPDMIPVVVDQIIRGLGRIREAHRVTSASLQKDPIDPLLDFKKIARTMMGPEDVKTEICAKLLEFYARGTNFMDEGEYLEAYEIFRKGYQAYYDFREKEGPKPKWGSIQNNEIEHAKVDISGMASESLSRDTSARRSMPTDGCAGPRLMTREIEAYNMSLAVALAERSLESPSLTDDRRFYGHYRRAVAFANLGDFLTELNTVVPKSEHAVILADTVAEWNDAGVCYTKAAQDAFYAVHVAGNAGLKVPQGLIDATNTLRRQMCDKVGYDADEHFAQMRRAGLARLQLPGLGLWEGDPALCEKFGPDNMMLLALFRQRKDSRGYQIADLKEELAQRGLRWVYNEDGLVFLDGNIDAHMNPTWVVPDDTRDGLRAAVLLEDKFEMARR